MIETATGLILRTRPLTETSLIVHWLTPNFGRIATAAKGARRTKSSFLGRLDLFYLADFSFSRSRRSDLHILCEVGLRETHNVLREDIFKLHQAAYAAAFIEQATEMETPLPAVYELLRDFLDCLCCEKSAAQTIFAFELKLLREIGLQPAWARTNLAAGTKKIVEMLLKKEWAAALRLKLTRLQTDELRQFLHGFLIFHLEKLPRGRAAALTENRDKIN
jgi:DNA repair protein RecO (recombination protein O)